MDAILITQCVQRDFVRTLGEGEALPNLVHVGRLEADRLCGPLGSLVPFLERAHAVPPSRLTIVHVGDRHDPLRHAAHLERFRPHCLAGSDGARLVAPLEELAAARGGGIRFVEGGDLNDFEDSSLDDVLRELAGDGALAGIRIGVVGVWTDVKVAFLLYELATRCRPAGLATCSALTASRSLHAHHAAIESLSAVLGVELFHSPGAFLDWLVPDTARTVLPAAVRPVAFTSPSPPPAWWEQVWVAEREPLLASVLCDRSALLTPLGGGFSGAQVFSVEGGDGSAHVVKLGRRDEVARERYGNERIGRILGDAIPRLLSYREGAALAAMEVELARSDDPDIAPPTTFKRAWEAQSGAESGTLLDDALRECLGGVLGRLYRTADKDNVDLLEAYGFVDRRGEPLFVADVTRVADDVARGCGHASAAEMLRASGLPGELVSPARFYGELLRGRSLPREVPVSLVHGDLNLANLLLSRRRSDGSLARIWIIDFARLASMPCLTDVAKVESDLTYVLRRVDAGAFARQALLQDARLTGTTLLDLEGMRAAAAGEDERYVRAVGVLRRVAAGIDPRGSAAMDDYRVALLRYAAHTLSFDEPGILDRGLALLACGRLAGQVAALEEPAR